MTFAGLSTVEPFGVRISPEGKVSRSAGIAEYPVLDQTGTRIATVYGVLLKGWTGEGVHVSDDGVRLDFVVPDEYMFVRRVIHGLNGLFFAISEGVLGRHIYPDFGCTIPICWCVETGRIASSANQMFDDNEYDARFLRDRYERLITSEGRGWIAGSLTAHRGVRRLLPGHALELSSMQMRRVWPLKGELKLGLGLAEASRTAADAVRGFVESVAREHRTAIALSAGIDSRIITASSKNVKDRVQYMTFGQPGDSPDQEISVKIAAALGLKHQLMPIVQATPEDGEIWDRLVSHCMFEINRRNHLTLAGVPADVVLTGVYGETGRNYNYRFDADTINDKPATSEFILSRLTLPADPELIAEGERWLEDLGWMPRSMALDLSFIEMKGASWGMGQSPAQRAVKVSMMPYIQPTVQKTFLQTAPDVKGMETLFTAMAMYLWPEIMDFPVNRYGNWRDRLGIFAKITNREKVVRYMRDRLAG